MFKNNKSTTDEGKITKGKEKGNKSQQKVEDIEESIEIIFNIVENEIKEQSEDFDLSLNMVQRILEMIMHIVHLVEEYNGKYSGFIKKVIVKETGERIIIKYYPGFLEYYNEHIDSIIESIINSYKILSHFKVSSCCFKF